MHWNEITKRLVVIGIALILVCIGLLGAVFHIKFNWKVVNQVSVILMLIAAAIIFSGRRPAKKSGEDQSAATTGEDAPEKKE